MLIIGIDPGISGSICFFENGIIKDVIEMPTMTDERMSDVDIIQGVDSKSCRKYNFSDIPFLQFNYTLQFYSSSASGFIVNAIVSPNMEIAAANIKTEV